MQACSAHSSLTIFRSVDMKKGREHYFKGMNLATEDVTVDSDNDGKCVILDVGGDRFVASRKHLERFPATR